MERQQFFAYLFSRSLPELQEILAQGHQHEKDLEALQRKALQSALARAGDTTPLPATVTTQTEQLPAQVATKISTRFIDPYKIYNSSLVENTAASRKRKSAPPSAPDVSSDQPTTTSVSTSSYQPNYSISPYEKDGGGIVAAADNIDPLTQVDETFRADWRALKAALFKNNPNFVFLCDAVSAYTQCVLIAELLQSVNKEWRSFWVVRGSHRELTFTRMSGLTANNMCNFQKGFDYFSGYEEVMTFVCAQACLMGDHAVVAAALPTLKMHTEWKCTCCGKTNLHFFDPTECMDCG